MRYLTLALAIALVSPAAGMAGETSAKLLEISEQRGEIAAELAKTIAACVRRRDTDHIAFHGCIDWHSAVHGTWALVAYGRATGDHQYEPLIDEILAEDNVRKEERLLRDRPRFEMPYGRAWFLRLAIEHDKRYGSGLLTPMGDFALRSLMKYFAAGDIELRSNSYESASWALINMYDYASFREDGQSLETIKRWIGKWYGGEGAACDPDWERDGFMAVCTNWAWLASRILDRAAFAAWVEKYFAKSGLPKPITSPKGWHQHGMNFSRAWGLWEIYAATGEAKYGEAYAEHFNATYLTPEKWGGSYQGVAHWVGQFGMFALQPAFGKNGR